MKKAYKINGKFLMGEDWQHFTKEVIASNKKKAIEMILSDIGSKHRVKRRSINIKELKEVSHDQIENPVVKYLMEK
jgi:large subunit ribosomal protein LX